MKNYEEIANIVFKRRDEYLAKQKKKKKIIIASATPLICCLIVLITGVGLWQGGVFDDKIHIVDNSQSNLTSSECQSPTESDKSSSQTESDKNNVTSEENNSSIQDFVSEPINDYESDYQGGGYPEIDIPSDSTPVTPPVLEDKGFIDSIDKMNFYSAKKIIDENSLWPFGMKNSGVFTPKTALLSNIYQYPININKVFTTTMVTYFTIELNDEMGFLAQKLEGTGRVEVVVTQNDIDPLGYMITFKRGNNYYSCLTNGGGYDVISDRTTREFSSHKYIEGFNIVKNLEQENYKFIVHYDGAKVIGFECAQFDCTPTKYNVDNVTLVDDFCVVLYTKKTFTIDQLEAYFKSAKVESIV